MDISEFDSLSGEDFEKVLDSLLKKQGFSQTKFTPKSSDFGADIIAQKNGKKVAIQSKRSTSPVGLIAVQQVLGSIHYYSCDSAFVISNATFTSSAKELASKAGVDLIDRKQLKKWISDIKLRDRPKDITPRPYQTVALESLKKLRKERATKALIIMASGLGKTYVAAFDCLNFEDTIGRPCKTLYLAHQSIILEQAKRSFHAVFGNSRSYGRFDGDLRQKDKEFTFATFHSFHNNIEGFDPAEYDYVIVDEAHHTAAPTRDTVVSYLKPRFLLGLTATPNRFDGKDITSYYDDLIPINLPLEKALADELLTPIDYRVFTDKSQGKELLKAIKTIQEEVDDISTQYFKPRSDQEIVRIIKSTSQQCFKNERTIIFCNSLKQMDHFSAFFKNGITVSGRDSRLLQIQKVDDFARGDYGVLLARDVLNEGIDVPSANLIVFLRNSESPVVFLQQLGRGLRKTDGKDKVVVLDFVCDIDRIRYVYSFYSRLISFSHQHNRVEGEDSSNRSSIDFDETSREIIKVLLKKKQEQGIIVTTDGIVKALDYKVSTATLNRCIYLGHIVPDYELPTGRHDKDIYFEHNTVKRFLRSVFSKSYLKGYYNDQTAAKALGIKSLWLRQKEKWGTIPASWFHLDSRGRITFYYNDEDLDKIKKHLTGG